MGEEFDHLVFLVKELFSSRATSEGKIILPWSALVVEYSKIRMGRSSGLQIQVDPSFELPFSVEQILCLEKYHVRSEEYPYEDVMQISFVKPLNLTNEMVDEIDRFTYQYEQPKREYFPKGLSVLDEKENQILSVVGNKKRVILFSYYDQKQKKELGKAVAALKGLEMIIA